jgi:hypothetical protein
LFQGKFQKEQEGKTKTTKEIFLNKGLMPCLKFIDESNQLGAI